MQFIDLDTARTACSVVCHLVEKCRERFLTPELTDRLLKWVSDVLAVGAATLSPLALKNLAAPVLVV